MNLSIPLTLHLQTETEPTVDQVQDALEAAWPWAALARQLGAVSATLTVDTLAESGPEDDP